MAQRLTVRDDRIAATDALPLVSRVRESEIGVRQHHRDAIPVGVHFVGDDHRQRIEDALTNLSLRADDAHLAIGEDLDVGRERAAGSGLLRGRGSRLGRFVCEHAFLEEQCAGGAHHHRHEEAAARQSIVGCRIVDKGHGGGLTR